MSEPGLVIDIGEVVLSDIAGAHPEMVRRLIEARMRGVLMESGATEPSIIGMDTGAIATQAATAVLQAVNTRGGRTNGS
jgi:hypothetical protein